MEKRSRECYDHSNCLVTYGQCGDQAAAAAVSFRSFSTRCTLNNIRPPSTTPTRRITHQSHIKVCDHHIEINTTRALANAPRVQTVVFLTHQRSPPPLTLLLRRAHTPATDQLISAQLQPLTLSSLLPRLTTTQPSPNHHTSTTYHVFQTRPVARHHHGRTQGYWRQARRQTRSGATSRCYTCESRHHCAYRRHPEKHQGS